MTRAVSGVGGEMVVVAGKSSDVSVSCLML